MLGMPKGPMQFEEDLAQIRNDMSRVQNDVNWMKEFGFKMLQSTQELRHIRRLLQLQQGYTTEEEVLQEQEKDEEVMRKLMEEHEERRVY